MDGPFFKEGEECSECTAGTDTNDYTVVKPLKCDADGAKTDGCPSEAIRFKSGAKHMCAVLKNCLAATSKVTNNEPALECTKCMKGYYLSKGQCTICKLPDETPADANDYRKCTGEDKNTFTQCPQTEWNQYPSRDHFYLVKVKAEPSKKECIKNENFCKTMLDTSKDCTKCYEGYYLRNVPAGVKCDVCNNADTGILNCKTCVSTGTGENAVTTCSACMDPVNLKNARNVYLTSDK